MVISYCFASPSGDVPVDAETLARPFIVEPLQVHPFLTLGDFFRSVGHFILGKAGPLLISALSQSWGRDVTVHDIDNIIIRYEKYGTLYQIASAEVFCGSLKAKFAVSVALVPTARENLQLEYNLLSYIKTKTGLSYLPRAFCINSQDIDKDGHVDTIVFTLAEWFEGYHEWHFSKDDGGKDKIVIWDTERGNRPASDQEAYTIIQEASKILTLYYNVDTCERIIPWHHGAGDFIVNTGSGNVELRLVTARGYEPFSYPDNIGTIDPSRGLLLFLLELTTKMRLDKFEGMGDTTWAGNGFVTAAVEGFFQALKTKEIQGERGSIKVDDFMASVKALSQNDIEELIRLQLDEYQARDTSDYGVIMAHLEEHAQDLITALRHFSPSMR
jgi:hypothetical protein